MLQGRELKTLCQPLSRQSNICGKAGGYLSGVPYRTLHEGLTPSLCKYQNNVTMTNTLAQSNICGKAGGYLSGAVYGTLHKGLTPSLCKYQNKVTMTSTLAQSNICR